MKRFLIFTLLLVCVFLLVRNLSFRSDSPDFSESVQDSMTRGVFVKELYSLDTSSISRAWIENSWFHGVWKNDIEISKNIFSLIIIPKNKLLGNLHNDSVRVEIVDPYNISCNFGGGMLFCGSIGDIRSVVNVCVYKNDYTNDLPQKCIILFSKD